jgi:hypothetical protein
MTARAQPMLRWRFACVDSDAALIAERGIGYVTAAPFFIAWSHPGRCHREAAFARLGGTSPVPATSGQPPDSPSPEQRRRPPPQPALYLVAATRQRCDPTTRAYIARRVAKGKTDREAIRCVKRFLARRVWRLLAFGASDRVPGRPSVFVATTTAGDRVRAVTVDLSRLLCQVGQLRVSHLSLAPMSSLSEGSGACPVGSRRRRVRSRDACCRDRRGAGPE